jgi:hypothetical protein
MLFDDGPLLREERREEGKRRIVLQVPKGRSEVGGPLG